MKAAAVIFIFIISAGAALLFFVNTQELEKAIASKPIGVCGGVVYADSYNDHPLSDEAKLGKDLFKANCAACHKLDKNLTGPYLRNINERYTSEDIIKFIRKDASSKIKTTETRGLICISFPQLSDDDIKHILSYTN